VRGTSRAIVNADHFNVRLKMRSTLTFLILIGTCFTAAKAEPPVIEFNGVKYILASTNVSKNTVTNEYVPIGESIDSWTTLIGVRYWPEILTANEGSNFWVSKIRSSLVRDAAAYAAAGKKNDLIVEAWLAPKDRSFVEINLHRFVVEEGTVGIKAYQFAQRIATPGGRGDVSSFAKSRNNLFAALQKLKLETHAELK
jgi:hypothetical protein